jgi:Flp pilus assembly protein TadD
VKVTHEQQAFDKAFNTGLSLARLGRWEDAVACYREAIRLCPDDAEAHLNLGFIYYELGWDAEARNEFDRVRALGGLANSVAKMRF